MKKILSYMSLAIAGLFLGACNEDFKDWTSQKAYDAEEAITIPGFTVSTLGTIDLNQADDAVKILSLSQSSLPEGATVDHLRFVATGAGMGIGTEKLNALNADGYFAKTDLQALAERFFGKRPVERQFAAHAYADVMINGQAAFVDAGEFILSLIPEAPQISQNYYIVGGPNDWAGSAAEKPLKFNHSDADVYDDPIFTIVFDAAAEGDTWFAIGDDAACDAIANDGDWTKLFGIVGGDSKSTSGSLDFRYNLGADNSFCVPAGAKKIKVTINMMEYTFKVEPVNIADAYYLVGGPGSWSSDKSQKFSHSSADVFDDPVFTYVFEGNGGTGDIWFAFGDADALNAIDAGDWSQLFGTKGESTDMSGSFDRRYNLGGDHSFCVDGKAKFYRFQINMANMTYEITPLNFDPYVYFIGATDGWANAEQKLALTDDSGIYTGYLYVADPNGWGVEFKFQKVPGDWDSQLNSNNLSDITGGFAKGGDNIVAAGGEGVYYVTLDMANLTLNAVKVEKMGIIGDFNGWGGDVEMKWNATDYCFEATGAGVTANGWKFRVNADWGINLGSNDSAEPSKVLADLVANGKNIGVAGNTVKLYPTRKTSDKIYCTVE